MDTSVLVSAFRSLAGESYRLLMAALDGRLTLVATPALLPDAIKREAERMAEVEGVSLDRWISNAVVKKIESTETAAEFFRRRGAGGSGERLREFLARVPDRGTDIEERNP